MGVGTPPSSTRGAHRRGARVRRPREPRSRRRDDRGRDARRRACRPRAARRHILRVLRFLDGARAAGRTSLAAAARAFLARHQRHRRGLVILLSDFYDPAATARRSICCATGASRSSSSRSARPRRRAPRCAATSPCATSRRARSATSRSPPRALAAYERRHAALVRELDGFCRERAIPCFAVTSDEAFDAVVLRVFRAGGLLR